MTVNKRKKNKRQRGHTTHGWGSMKKHRGKGHQGGAGMAGTGKRADSKKPSIWKEEYFGKHGFISKTPKVKIREINIRKIEESAEKLIAAGLMTRENEFYSVEIEKIGFNKLLGDGKVSMKFKIKAPFASKNAIEKIKDAGGEVTGLADVLAK